MDAVIEAAAQLNMVHHEEIEQVHTSRISGIAFEILNQ
jgi:hypothetical protein